MQRLVKIRDYTEVKEFTPMQVKNIFLANLSLFN